ncbi:uncharacterized protein LOC122446300 isoform X2 [Cervus canadensis]|uniref:uncharacterized protein LOC122446300 isoform X2 n=1 Tax=Cervus canadensis TaxID=1574408 RepID=UPI001C9E55E9|nr:uncharacterized protein LOC122446300 isoform X2 [Cervus canadensis]
MRVSRVIDSWSFRHSDQQVSTELGDSSIGHPHPNCPGFSFFRLWSLLHKELKNHSLLTSHSLRDRVGPNMSVKYEDLQYSESEKKSQGFTEDFKFQSDLQTLRTGFSNFTSNTTAEVQALNSQGGNLQEMITSLKAEVESHKQELQAGWRSNWKNSKQQLAKNLNSLTCKMDALKSNFSQNTACCPANWLEHEGRCYWFSSLGKPWPEAEKDCQLKNAHLVVINSREEQDFIQANLRPYFTCMGLSDPDGVWKWVDGSDYETNIKVIVKMQHDVYICLAHHKEVLFLPLCPGGRIVVEHATCTAWRLCEDHPHGSHSYGTTQPPRALPTNVGEAGYCNPCISRVRSQRQVRGHGRGGVHSSPLPSSGLGV